jgi:hypothetical protein
MQGLDGQFSFRPIAFYNKLNGESRVVKVYFDLTLSKICKRCTYLKNVAFMQNLLIF